MANSEPITSHEGSKYLRVIHDAAPNLPADEGAIHVDVYAVLVAFGVTCPARQHCLKKLLCAGTRGKGDELADLIGAEAALNRAIELQELANRTVEKKRQDEGSGLET